ncbi:MAG: HEAT repeat domain-containing protein [Alphaproteobacteria bacterium]|nr:HEAT repeat domain-containing protein [Alphaproteobacteria bacterium]
MRSCSRLLLLLALLGGCRKPVTPEPLGETPEARGELDAREVLMRGAASLDVGVRTRALDLLIRFDPEPAGGAWGPRALFDPSPSVQRVAAQALGARLPEPTSVALLEGLVQRAEVDPYVRGAAAFILGQAGHVDALPALQEQLAAERAHWRQAPLALGAAVMGDAEAAAALPALIAKGDFPLEIGFFLDCGRSGLAPLAPALIEASERVEEELVLPIAAALVMLGDRRGEALFREALSAERPEQRMEAVDYLVLLEGETAIELLEKARSTGPEPVKVYARMSLLARGQEDPELALAALASPDREQRQHAVWALSHYLSAAEDLPKRERKRLQDALRAGLGDPEAVVVIETIQGLARAGEPQDRALIAGLVGDDPALALEVEVAAALLEMGG